MIDRAPRCGKPLSIPAMALIFSVLGTAVMAQAPSGGWAGDAPASPALAGPVPSGPGSLQGTWSNAIYKPSDKFPERERILLDDKGQWPPLLPAAKALLEKRIQDSIDGHPFANTLSECLPGGVPQMLFGAGYPIQILETPGQITMLMDEQNHFRIIRLDGKHAADPDPSYFGDSIGHWEKDGWLVVDTIGLTERTTLDQIGMPHSEDMHVVERYRRTAADRFEVEVTIDDPKTFSRPWTTKAAFRAARADGMQEYICENQRNPADASGHQSFK